MNRKVIFSVLALPLAGLVAFIFEILLGVVIEAFSHGFLDKYLSNDQMQTQGGYLVIIMTVVFYVVLLWYIWKKLKG